MRKQPIMLTALGLLASIAAGNLYASDLCHVAEADRQPIEALQSKLESDGWKVKTIKVDDGCYEAYALNSEGERVEAYFNPQTFELIKSEKD